MAIGVIIEARKQADKARLAESIRAIGLEVLDIDGLDAELESDLSLIIVYQESFCPEEITSFANQHHKIWERCLRVLLTSSGRVTSEASDLGIDLVMAGDQFTKEALHSLKLFAEMQLKNQYLGEMLLITRTLNDELEKLSHCDNLTGLPNRRRFEEIFELEWRRAARERHSMAVCMLDVDHFKIYNDTWGHQAGDQCLQQVAGCLQACFRRPGDIIARYGGEEFVGLLAHTDKRGAHIVFEWLRKRVEDLRLPHPERGHVTISLGYATATPSKKSSPHDLIRQADEALYRAKEEGRNRVRNYRSPQSVGLLTAPFQLQRPR